MIEAATLDRHDVLLSGRSVLATRPVPGVFAMIGAPDIDVDTRDVSVSVDNRPVQGPLVTFHLRRSERRPVVVTVASGGIGAGDHVRWSVGDTVLANGRVGERIRLADADPGAFAALAPEGQERREFVCQLIETICVHMRQKRNAGVSDFCHALVMSLAPSFVDVPISLIDVGERETVVAIDTGETGASHLILHHFGQFGFSRPVGPAMSVSGSGLKLFRFEHPVHYLQKGTAVLWAGNVVRVCGPSDMRTCGPERLGEVLDLQQPTAIPTVRWLSYSLRAGGSPASRTAAVLHHADIAACLSGKAEFSAGDHARVGLSAVFRSPGAGLAVFGWRIDSHDSVAEMAWLGPNDVRIAFGDKAHSVPHRGLPTQAEDLLEPGRRVQPFVACICTPRPLVPLGSEGFRVTFANGVCQEALVAPPTRNVKVARDLILSMFDPNTSLDALFDNGLGEIVGSFHRLALATKSVVNTYSLGRRPDLPRTSIIVPIYGSSAYLSSQYAGLALDADVRRHDELIYVVDDPSIADRVKAQLTGLFGIYGLPARILVHDDNYGYAPAVNTGADEAAGEHLLLLNSDVVPTEKGFVRRLVRRLAVDRRVGAVGPKLLFQDGSIQHAGLSFARAADGRVFNRSLFKGYPRDHRKANRRSTQEALTGACLLLRREAWEAVGGLSEDYIIGDFEDTDLCLGLRAIGFRLEYEPRAELFHFERQSIDQHETHRTSRAEDYNRWLHMRRWFSEGDRGFPLLETEGVR